MENAPAIILFWYAVIALIILTLAFMTAAILLLKRSRNTNVQRMRLWGIVCLVLSAICGLPILLVVGYILYIYIS